LSGAAGYQEIVQKKHMVGVKEYPQRDSGKAMGAIGEDIQGWWIKSVDGALTSHE
jgi:hypothetical protein